MTLSTGYEVFLNFLNVMTNNTIYFIVFLAVSILGCTNQKRASRTQSIVVGYNMPLYNSEGEIKELKTSYDVLYQKNLRVYRFPFGFDSVVNGVSVFGENREGFFAYHTDSIYGYVYDIRSVKSDPNTRRLVADKLEEIRFGQLKL